MCLEGVVHSFLSYQRLTRVPGAAQHEAKRNGALQTRDRYGPRRSRIVCRRRLPKKAATGGTSRSRKVFTTVLIWRPAGVSAVRNTNGRRGSTPGYNRVRGP